MLNGLAGAPLLTKTAFCRHPIVVANREHDLALLLVELLTDEELPVQVFVNRVHGYADDLVTLVKQLQSRICIYGLTYPYADSWVELQAVQQRLPDCRFLATGASVRAMLELPGAPSIECIDGGFDLEAIVSAVRRVLITAA